MKKTRYDVGQRHTEQKAECEARMAEIQRAKPDDYFNDAEYRCLAAEARIANLKIKLYEGQIARGVKF